MMQPFKVLYIGPAKSEAFDTTSLEQQSRAADPGAAGCGCRDAPGPRLRPGRLRAHGRARLLQGPGLFRPRLRPSKTRGSGLYFIALAEEGMKRTGYPVTGSVPPIGSGLQCA